MAKLITLIIEDDDTADAMYRQLKDSAEYKSVGDQVVISISEHFE